MPSCGAAPWGRESARSRWQAVAACYLIDSALRQ